MKRTGEVILTTIALFFTYLGTIRISTVLLFSNLDEIRKLFQEDYFKEEALPVTFESIDAFLNLFISLRWLVLLTVIVGTVLGTLSLFYFVRNNSPRASSILAIISSGISSLVYLDTEFRPFNLLPIAGVTGLMRKTSNTPYSS